jgi:hypothetical protein
VFAFKSVHLKDTEVISTLEVTRHRGFEFILRRQNVSRKEVLMEVTRRMAPVGVVLLLLFVLPLAMPFVYYDEWTNPHR